MNQFPGDFFFIPSMRLVMQLYMYNYKERNLKKNPTWNRSVDKASGFLWRQSHSWLDGRGVTEAIRNSQPQFVTTKSHPQNFTSNFTLFCSSALNSPGRTPSFSEQNSYIALVLNTSTALCSLSFTIVLPIAIFLSIPLHIPFPSQINLSTHISDRHSIYLSVSSYQIVFFPLIPLLFQNTLHTHTQGGLEHESIRCVHTVLLVHDLAHVLLEPTQELWGLPQSCWEVLGIPRKHAD